MTYSATAAEGPPPVLKISGSLDITTVGDFANKIDTISRGGMHPLVVDLTDVDVLASAGLQALFAARDHHRIHGNQLVILASEGSVAAQALDLVGLDSTSARAQDD